MTKEEASTSSTTFKKGVNNSKAQHRCEEIKRKEGKLEEEKREVEEERSVFVFGF